MSRNLGTVVPSVRRVAAGIAVAIACAVAPPAFAVDHTVIQPREGSHDGRHDGDRDRGFRRGPSSGLYFGGPAYVAPPPVYYAPAYPDPYGYPYAPVPLTGVYTDPSGYYCRDYRTAVGIETACLQPDGVWRFVD